jgi:multisubunit Na+/H+ antiporter MnhG subunit
MGWIWSFFAVPADLTFWKLLDSNFSAACIGVYAVVLSYRVGRAEHAAKAADEKAEVAKEQAEDAGTIVKANETIEESEETLVDSEPSTSTYAPTQGDFRSQAEDVVNKAKNYLDNTASNDTDKRRQRTYKSISGHRPAFLAVALKEREQINQDQMMAAIALFKLWQLYSKGRAASRPVPNSVYQSLRSSLKSLSQGT